MQITWHNRKAQQSCAFCRSTECVALVHVEEAPLFLGCTKKAVQHDQFVTFDVVLCPGCGLIQTDAEAHESSYEELHSEALGPTWQAHHVAFADFVTEALQGRKDLQILEIGASSSPLCRYIGNPEPDIWYVDPIKEPPFTLQPRERYMSGFFPATNPGFPVDVVIASHVFEHIPHSQGFMNDLREQLKPGGHFIISIPHFKHWLEKAYFNALSAEHVIYPFVDQLSYLAKTCGYTFESKIYKEHSLFACFTKSESKTFSEDAPSLYQSNYNLLSQWVQKFHKALQIEQIPAGADLFITGASHLSQYVLLNLPEIQAGVKGVLDNSERKWGERLYGTSCYACSFTDLSHYEKPFVLLTPSPYSAEMRAQIKELNANTTIIEL